MFKVKLFQEQILDHFFYIIFISFWKQKSIESSIV